MTATVVLGLAIGLGAPAPKDGGPPITLYGEWVIEKCTAGGIEQDAKAMSVIHWVFRKDGQRTLVGTDGKEMAGGQYTTDTKAGILDLGGDLCRFKVDGDTLTLNIGWPKAP